MTAKVVKLASREAVLVRKVRRHLRELGFVKNGEGKLVPPNLDKESYRRFHESQRQEKVRKNSDWMSRDGIKTLKFFADGADIIPERIAIELECVSGDSWQSDLFRMAAMYWQIPVSDGYGRRMRFLVWDRSNDKLVGIIALGDGVFNQAARDNHIGWDHHRRGVALVNLMDAYVLGALPPYNMLLGGKLVASLLRSSDIVDTFEKKYRGSVGLISQEEKKAKLVAITTSSAFGRSSVYNRLALNGRKILEPIGYTSGWGHFHFSGTIFDDLRSYLESVGDDYSSGFEFGSGPNWRIRVIRKALERIGMDTSLAKHGFQRQVFFCAVAKNAIPYLRGSHTRPIFGTIPSAAEVAESAKERWILPRSKWDARFKDWRREDFVQAINCRKLVKTFSSIGCLSALGS